MLRLPKIITKTLSVRLSLMVVSLIALLLLLSLALMFHFSRQVMREEAMQDAEQTLEGTVQHIDNILLSVEQSTGNIYWDLMAHLDRQDLMLTYARRLVTCNPNIIGCAIVFKPYYYPDHELFMAYVHRKGHSPTTDENMELVTSETFTDKPYTKQVWYTQPMETGRACWIDPLKGEDTEDEPLTSFCLPLYSRGTGAEMEVVGVVAVDLSIDLLSRIVLDAKPSANGYTMLLASNGSYIVHPDPEKLSYQTVFTQMQHGADPSVLEAAESMVAGETGYKTFRMKGQDWCVFYKPFQRAEVPGRANEKLGWSVGVVYPEDDVFGDYNHLLYLLLAIAVVGLLLFFVLCQMVTHRQLMPLRILTQSAQRIAGGHYDETIPETRRGDEVGQLQDHFQHMQQSLAAHVSELEQMTATLNERSEVLRKTYEQAKEADQMKTVFLHNMTNQMIAPADAINKSVTDLCDHYQDISHQEADREVNTIQQESQAMIDLLSQMIHSADDRSRPTQVGRVATGPEPVRQAPPLEGKKKKARKGEKMAPRLSLGIVLMAAPIFVLALGILYFQSRRYIHMEASERANSILNTTTQRVRNYMSAVETATNSNIWYAEEYFHPDSLLSLTRRIVTMNRHVNGCSISAEPEVFPQQGRYFSVYTADVGDTIVSVREPAYEYFDKVWYKTALISGKASWVDPFDEYTDGTLNPTETIASYCRPLRLKDQIVGVISTDLSFRRLAETIEASGHPYPNGYYMLIDGNGRYLIHPDSTRLYKKTIFTDSNPDQNPDVIALGHEMTAGKEGTTHVTIAGTLYHVCYRHIPNTDWNIALVCPDNDILKSYHELTNIVVALIVIGLLVILLLCSRAVAHAITPINHLLDLLKQMAAGNYNAQIPHTDREDAIGQLQNSFATMQQSLDFHMGGIHHTAEETRKRNEELAHVTKLAQEAVRQKTLFIQNVSHQMRTPLNIIMGFAQVLRDSLTERDASVLQQEEVTSITGMMKYNSIHLNRMVLMLYDSSDTGISEELVSHRDDLVSCNEIVRECIYFTHLQFPDLPVRFESALPDDYRIKTNHLYLMRALRELIYNAAKYSDGKHIAMTVSLTETTVRFTVEDVGPGIPEESQELLFKPFAKVDDLSEGLGLGLPLSKRHALGLGGDLYLDTDYHDGCRFIVEMPI